MNLSKWCRCCKRNGRTDLIELNVSCPNLKAGGKAFGMSSEDTYSIVKSVREITDKPLIPKLTPNVTDITTIASAAEEAGADAVSLTNTYIGMAIDVHSRKPKLGNIIEGYQALLSSRFWGWYGRWLESIHPCDRYRRNTELGGCGEYFLAELQYPSGNIQFVNPNG